MLRVPFPLRLCFKQKRWYKEARERGDCPNTLPYVDYSQMQVRTSNSQENLSPYATDLSREYQFSKVISADLTNVSNLTNSIFSDLSWLLLGAYCSLISRPILRRRLAPSQARHYWNWKRKNEMHALKKTEQSIIYFGQIKPSLLFSNLNLKLSFFKFNLNDDN